MSGVNGRNGRNTALSVVVAGGGTAGHIEPAMAVADAVRALDPSAVVTALGTQRGLETTLVPERGYPLELIPPVPLPRKPTMDLLRLPARLRRSIAATREVLDRTDADVIVGFGVNQFRASWRPVRRRKPTARQSWPTFRKHILEGAIKPCISFSHIEAMLSGYQICVDIRYKVKLWPSQPSKLKALCIRFLLVPVGPVLDISDNRLSWAELGTQKQIGFYRIFVSTRKNTFSSPLIFVVDQFHSQIVFSTF